MSEANNNKEQPTVTPPRHYKCGDCGREFDMPVPRGPSKERSRTCPGCHSQNIQRLDTGPSAACPPGS